MTEADRAEVLKSLEQREVALVRALLRDPTLLDGRAEAGLRTALSVARLHHVRGPQGDVDVEQAVLPLRDEVFKLLDLAGLKPGAEAVLPEKLRPVSSILRDHALRTLNLVRDGHRDRLPAEVLDREVRLRRLVIAAGGGGGSAYVYFGAFKLLEERGLRPALVAGTSMGAILGLFRARSPRYETGEIFNAVRSLSWGKLFQLLSMESRYGLPAALRLYLRAAIGRFFVDGDGQPLRLSQLSIPFIACVSGIRAGVLPRPLEFYEQLLDDVRRSPTPFQIGRKIPTVVSALLELAQLSERLERLYLGLDPGTEEFDVIDAVGFSSALPGVIHYDIVRRDERMHALLGKIFAERELFRLADGSLVDNVPATAAWRGVQRGMIGTRNAFILAMDGFSPKLTTPVWLPMQQLVAAQVQRSCGHAHLYKAFKRPLSPLELVPSVDSAMKMLERGKEELLPDLPFIQRMLEPLPPPEALETAA